MEFQGNVIHPTAQIGPDVTMGTGNRIDANVVISGTVSLGDNNWICAGVILGAVPEIRALRPDAHGNLDMNHRGVVIGSGTVIREGAQVHQGHKRETDRRCHSETLKGVVGTGEL